MINSDLLVDLMTEFEQGKGGNIFELEHLTPQVMQQIDAFAQMAAQDTERSKGMLGLTEEPGDLVAYVIAGIMQGLWLGYEYAKREH